jgi:hypothetical protein
MVPQGMAMSLSSDVRRPLPGSGVSPRVSLPPGLALLTIGVLSLLSWAILISIGTALFDGFLGG